MHFSFLGKRYKNSIVKQNYELGNKEDNSYQDLCDAQSVTFQPCLDFGLESENFPNLWRLWARLMSSPDLFLSVAVGDLGSRLKQDFWRKLRTRAMFDRCVPSNHFTVGEPW